jgi:O-antigen ligase
MAIQIDWPRWAFAGMLAAVAASCGVLAGADPKLAIRVAVGIGFLVIAFTDLSMGLAIFIFASFVSMYPYTRYDVAARLILVMAWLALILTRRRSELEFTAVHPIAAGALLLFIGWAWISVGWSESTGHALMSATQYTLSALLLLITYTAVRNREDLGRVLVAFLLGAVASVIYALAGPNEEARLANTVLDPNLLGASLVCGLAIAVAIIAMYRPPAIRVLVGVSALLILAGILMTTSRSSLIALAVAGLAAIMLAGRWRALFILIAALVVGATFVYYAQFAPQTARDRVEAPLSGTQRSQDGRNTIWQLAFRAIEDEPVTGVGAGNFRVVQRRYLIRPGVDRANTQDARVISDPRGKVAHNSFLSVATELGAIGTVLFVFVIGFGMVSMRKAAALFARAGDPRMRAVAVALIVATVGLLSVQMFQSDQQGKPLWLLCGLGPALLAIAKASEPGAADPGRR